MAINLVTFAAQTVTPQDDALIYESALTGSGMIYGGTVTIKSANVLRVAEGHGALCGRKFTIEAMDVPIALTPSGSLLGRIYIHMDLADTDEPISIRVETASSLTPVIQDTDVNINNGVYEINLATFTVNTSTISNLVNVAPDLQSTQELSEKVSNSGDAYSPNRAYKVGELAIHDNKLYRCITDCSAAAWSVNQSCFTSDTLTNAVTSLNTRSTIIESYSVISAAGSSMSAITHNAIKQNGMLTLNCSCSGNNLPRNSWVTVGTLVNGWRPTTQTPFSYSDNNSVTSIGRINTNGLIQLVNPNSNSSGVLASATFNVTFALA